jgi:hypothetical protein
MLSVHLLSFFPKMSEVITVLQYAKLSGVKISQIAGALTPEDFLDRFW